MNARRISVLVLGLLVGGLSVALSQVVDQCYTCHQSLGDKVSALFGGDIHRTKGISCAGCHGGNASKEEMEEAMNPSAGFIGVPKGDAISERCASCHGDQARMKEYRSKLPTSQYESYKASVHGQLAISGKERTLQCTSCHNAHGIVPPSNSASPVHPLRVVATCARCHSDASYMRKYNPTLPVDQLVKYRTSVHGERNAKGDPKVAECVSCHGSHDIRLATDVKSRVYATNLPKTCAHCHSDAQYMKAYRIPTNQFEEYAGSVHGIALLQKNDLAAPACNDCHDNHGAIPPGIESISKVCGMCHALNADLFAKSPHKQAFDKLGLPECETCHGNHAVVAATDQLLGVSSDAVCSRCHSPQKNVKGFETAALMRQLVDSLVRSEDAAKALVEEAEQKGMEVGEAKFKLREARQARLQSRTAVHSFNAEQFQEVVGKGLATTSVVSQEATTAIDEYYYRRTGLGIATLIITVLAFSLFLLIRRTEARKKG
jgi:predicted CXXCH cytochrome family protein